MSLRARRSLPISERCRRGVGRGHPRRGGSEVFRSVPDASGRCDGSQPTWCWPPAHRRTRLATPLSPPRNQHQPRRTRWAASHKSIAELDRPQGSSRGCSATTSPGSGRGLPSRTPRMVRASGNSHLRSTDQLWYTVYRLIGLALGSSGLGARLALKGRQAQDCCCR